MAQNGGGFSKFVGRGNNRGGFRAAPDFNRVSKRTKFNDDGYEGVVAKKTRFDGVQNNIGSRW